MHHRPSAQVLIDPREQQDHAARTGHLDEPGSAPSGAPLQPPPSPPEIPSTYLTPADPFPTAPAELELVDLHVLHSRIARQLDREYRTDPAGPHPVTLDRAQELAAELDTRQEFLEPRRPTPAPIGETARGPATTPVAAPGAGPAQRPGAAAAGTRTRRHPSAPRPRHVERPDGPFPYPDRSVCRLDVRIQDLDRLWPGDQVEIWHDDKLQGVGYVEQAAPALGVVWIRDALDGCRSLLHLHDTVLRYHLGAEPRPAVP